MKSVCLLPALAVLLLAGCGPGGPKPDGGGEPDRAPATLATRFDIDFTHGRLGQSVLFSIEDGASHSIYKISVVEESGSDIWVEEKIPATPVPWIQKTLMDRTGEAKEIWRGEIGSRTPQKWWTRGDKVTIRRKVMSDLKVRSVEKDAMTEDASGRRYTCTMITTTLSRAGRKDVVVMDWCSPEVPFPIRYSVDGSTKTYGGLVLRVVVDSLRREIKVKLFSVGSEARPELEIPK